MKDAPVTRDDLVRFTDMHGRVRTFDERCVCRYCRACLAERDRACLCGMMPDRPQR